MPFRPSRFRTTLARSLTDGGSEVEIYLNSLTTRQGHVLTMAEIGTKGYLKINPGSENEEIVSFTGIDISGATPKVTGVIRGYNDYSTGTAAANKKPHSPGAPVIITNDDHYLSDTYMDAQSDETITGLKTFSVLPQTTAGNATDDNQFVRYAQALALLSGGTYSQNRVVVAGNAGETVAAGNLVYLDVADGEWKKCDADTAATVENANLGIAQGAGTDGNAIASGVLIFGLDSNQTGLSNNTKYYASNTAGAIASSAGTKEVTIGISRSTTTLLFMPRYDQTLTEDLQDALTAGGAYGTPSASNPFRTLDFGEAPVTRTYNLADSPATWTKPARLKYVEVEAWGGGGSGGTGTGGGAGGGGGAYRFRKILASDLGATETVTIGAGGASRGSNNQDGAAGGNTTFGAFLTAYGGGGGGGNSNPSGGGGGGLTSAGGNAVTTTAGAGGGPMGGAAGSASVGGNSLYGGGGGGTASQSGGDSFYGGGGGTGGGGEDPGGNSIYGGGGGAGGTGTAAGGTSLYGGAGGSLSSKDGAVPGGGGAGTTAPSGAGGAGRVKVTEYYY